MTLAEETQQFLNWFEKGQQTHEDMNVLRQA